MCFVECIRVLYGNSLLKRRVRRIFEMRLLRPSEVIAEINSIHRKATREYRIPKTDMDQIRSKDWMQS